MLEIKVEIEVMLEINNCLFPKGECQIDLDDMIGKFPPLLVKDGKFVFPTDDQRKLTFAEGESLQLLCHGSHM